MLSYCFALQREECIGYKVDSHPLKGEDIYAAGSPASRREGGGGVFISDPEWRLYVYLSQTPLDTAEGEDSYHERDISRRKISRAGSPRVRV